MKHWPKQIAMRYVALLGCLMLVEPNSASAAEPRESNAAREAVTVTTSLITPIFGAYELAATVRASDAFGLVFNTSYLSLANDDWKTQTGTVGAGVNYYFLGNALRRWYVEVIGELLFSSWRHEPSREVAPIVLGYSGIVLVGYKFVWDGGPVLDVGAGAVALRFPSAHVELADGGLSSEAFCRVYPAVKLSVGWAF